ncbi:MAG: hypothetical protein AAFY88_21335 [Acidobacteriota bacterium]
MRSLGGFVLILLALLGPFAAAGPAGGMAVAAAANAAPVDGATELHAPAEPLAEQPARTFRLEPPERWLLEVAPSPAVAGAPKLTPSTSAVRGSTLRPWAPKAPLHLELCRFLC